MVFVYGAAGYLPMILLLLAGAPFWAAFGAGVIAIGLAALYIYHCAPQDEYPR